MKERLPYLAYENLQNRTRNQRRKENSRERTRNVARTRRIHTINIQKVLDKGYIRQTSKGIHHLKQKDLGDQIVLIFRVCAVILVIVQEDGNVLVDKI